MMDVGRRHHEGSGERDERGNGMSGLVNGLDGRVYE